MNGVNSTDLFINNIYKLKDNLNNKRKISIKEKTQTEIFIKFEEKTEAFVDSKEDLDSKEDEIQTKTFVNAKGERIVAIKMPFGGFQYIKVGEMQDSLLNNKTSSNIEMLEKAYNTIDKSIL